MEKEHGEKVAILAIDIQESQAKVASFAKRKGIAYRVLLDFKADVARLYNIVGTPTLVLIDEAGCIQYKGHDIRQARTELLRLLEGKSE
jgi:peroxiredoxin